MSLGMLCLLSVAFGELPPVDFDTQIVPVLTVAGCNSGACHGAALGQGGFALSLWGGDPSTDYEAIVRRQEGRRVNLARPEASLLLRNPAGLLDHGDSDLDGALDCVDLCPGANDSLFAPGCADAIPAASTWGLIVLMLLFMVGAKVVFTRRAAVV